MLDSAFLWCYISLARFISDSGALSLPHKWALLIRWINMAESISFTVIGTPIPQGSSRAFLPKGWKRPIITAANSKTKPWRQEIAGTALAAANNVSWPVYAGVPIYLFANFYFERPKTVKANHKTTKPDVDKLFRSLGDSLTGILFKDDAQIIECYVSKHFGSPARVEVSVSVIEF